MMVTGIRQGKQRQHEDIQPWRIAVWTAAMVLGQLAEVLHLPVLSYVGCCVVLISVFLGDRSTAYYAAAYFLSSGRILTLLGFSINLYILLLYCFKYVILQKGKLYVWFLIIGGVFSLYTLQYVPTLGVSAILDLVRMLVLLWFCADLFADERVDPLISGRRTLTHLALGILVSTAVAFVCNPDMLRQTRFALSSDSGENSLGIQCGIVLSIYLLLFIRKQSRAAYALPVILLVAAVGVLTGSATFLVLCGIAVVWVIATGSLKTKFKFLALAAVAGVVLVVILAREGEFGERIAYLIQQIVSPKNDDISNGRFDIWRQYFTLFREQPRVLWLGAGSYTAVGMDYAAHNFFLEQIVTYGVVGNVLLAIAYGYAGRTLVGRLRARRPGLRIDVGAALPFVLVFAAGMVSHSLFSISQTFLLFIGVYCMYALKGEEDLCASCG